MPSSISIELEKLKTEIKKENISEIASKTNNWNDFGIIITSPTDSRLKDILKKIGQIAVTFQNHDWHQTLIITEYAKELSWVFNKIKDIFIKSDFIVKNEFFKKIAQATNKKAVGYEELLLNIIKSAGEYRGNFPDDMTLPFFAYGLFKKDQLCYYRIKDFVDDNGYKTEISGKLKERDGVPILVKSNQETHHKITGYLFNFNENNYQKAYESIMQIEPTHVYKWDTILINGKEVNVLCGKYAGKGTADIEKPFNWDFRKDPFFNEGLTEVGKILEENNAYSDKPIATIRLQMGYALLWSIIERFTGLKYNLSQNNASKRAKMIIKEKSFEELLKKNVSDNRDGSRVFSAASPKKPFKLDKSNPNKAIDYYYQVRSNSVHRGKVGIYDNLIIEYSLKELYNIFSTIYNEEYNKNKEIP
ncbi:hypothetical protein [Methanobrevibacter sp. DSM 116169]|uniref:hypothetical protein n=1 Tax=Methanobrevibacter sp. DSM 116169 TaxID=3242727 RepID=UPI0038FC9B2D